MRRVPLSTDQCVCVRIMEGAIDGILGGCWRWGWRVGALTVKLPQKLLLVFGNHSGSF